MNPRRRPPFRALRAGASTALAALGIAGASGCSSGRVDSPSDTGDHAGTGNAGATSGSGGTTGGTVSASGTNSGPNIDLGGASTTGGATSSGGVCNAEAREGQRVPLDLFFLVDSSGSMTEDIQGGGTRWEAVSDALIDFLKDPKNGDIAVGIGYFPVVPKTAVCTTEGPDCICILPPICISISAASCEVADYSTPTVPLALPPNPGAVALDLQNHKLNGGTPTRPALEGAVRYVSSWAAMHPDRKSVIVLATDGEPAGCEPNNTPQDVANVAASALSSSAIQTFVIGVGSSLQNLNLIAQAGGSMQAYLVEDANAATAFGAALEKIHGVASPCDFLIPTEGSQGNVDPSKVNVKYTPTGTTTPTLVAQTSDGSAATCGAEGGWHYDNPKAPGIIKLCPATCASLSGGSVQVEFCCQTIVQPPR